MSHPPLACPELIGFEAGQPHLIGSICADCGETYFPATTSCTRCLSDQLEPHALGRRGRLWSWTIQGFLPKAPYDGGETPESFRPYGVGYVEMSCGIKVESRLTIADPAELSIGMTMELILHPYRTSDDGSQLFTFAFRPANAIAGSFQHGQ